MGHLVRHRRVHRGALQVRQRPIQRLVPQDARSDRDRALAAHEQRRHHQELRRVRVDPGALHPHRGVREVADRHGAVVAEHHRAGVDATERHADRRHPLERPPARLDGGVVDLGGVHLVERAPGGVEHEDRVARRRHAGREHRHHRDPATLGVQRHERLGLHLLPPAAELRRRAAEPQRRPRGRDRAGRCAHHVRRSSRGGAAPRGSGRPSSPRPAHRAARAPGRRPRRRGRRAPRRPRSASAARRAIRTAGAPWRRRPARAGAPRRSRPSRRPRGPRWRARPGPGSTGRTTATVPTGAATRWR